jgi:hypothetical protein
MAASIRCSTRQLNAGRCPGDQRDAHGRYHEQLQGRQRGAASSIPITR